MKELFQFIFLFGALYFVNQAILSLFKAPKKDESLADKLSKYVNLNPIEQVDLEETDITSFEFKKMKRND